MSNEIAPIPDVVKDAWTGKKWGRFELVCRLGAGGMSEVFLALQRSVAGFERPVVLKRILDQVKGQEDFVHMFVQEAKITSTLSHGNIAQLFDLAEEQGELFMVMEFVPGATLVEVARACLIAREPIPLGLALAAVRDTALALHYAHAFKDASGRARSVVHRDVAEKNIMVSLDGVTKLLDFGIARQAGRSSRTQVGTVKGTAGYMSPEQVRGEKLDGRTDLFSLGIVLHECLTGQRLFKGATRQEEMQQLLESPIPAPSQRNRTVPLPIDAVALKALSRDREHRYATGQEFAFALERAAGGAIWDEKQRAEFMQKHFARRRDQIRALLGDPGVSDAGELGDAGFGTARVKAMEEDEPATVLALPAREEQDRRARTTMEGRGRAELAEEATRNVVVQSRTKLPQVEGPRLPPPPPKVTEAARQTADEGVLAARSKTDESPAAAHVTHETPAVGTVPGTGTEDAGTTLPGDEAGHGYSGDDKTLALPSRRDTEEKSAPSVTPVSKRRPEAPAPLIGWQTLLLVAGLGAMVAAILLLILL